MTDETLRAPTMLKRLGAVALVAAGLAAPLATAGAAEARDGCGPGGHRGPYGYCRPNFGPRPYYAPYAYRPAFYGPRWHRWGGGYGYRGWHHRW